MLESVESPKTRYRIESLSDLVFGLALSLGSFILISKPILTSSDLLSGILLFAFSFLIVVWTWSGYSRVMTVLPYEIRGTYLLNLVLLFCVAIEPYLLYVLFSAPFAVLEFASTIFALDVGALMFILASLVYMLLAEEKKRTSRRLNPAQLDGFKGVMWGRVVAGTIFILSALPFTWAPFPAGSSYMYLRFDMWYANFAIFFAISYIGRDRNPS
jgi:uncharacterized membrane protein